MNLKPLTIAIAGLLSMGSIFSSNASETSPANAQLLDQLKKQLETQQIQIEALIKKVERNELKVKSTDEKIEATVTAIEDNLSSSVNSKTTIGGYGELHYNNIEDKESIDFHRFVLFFAHEFTDSIRLFSELELEHAFSGEGKPGEVELEQAYIEMDLTESTTMKTGVFLIPVGITNETHEPPTFYGVERNPVEKNIIPATWWEAGAGFNTRFSDGLSADFAIHSGLNVPTDGSKAFLIRSGRQKVAKANADSLAYTARIKYTAMLGLELAATYQIQTDVSQGALGADANLFSAHVTYSNNGFGVRALYAAWNISGSEAALVGRDSQEGFYIEPSYRINDKFGLFARYNAWDNNAGDADETEMKQTNVGLNYWPHEDVVFKIDIENRFGAQDGSGFNLGVGYQF
ncbi:MAG: porin [Gammaproteobacteria bacterium]|nr:MAG: porin [Gammaproteobacteria bacterium]